MEGKNPQSQKLRNRIEQIWPTYLVRSSIQKVNRHRTMTSTTANQPLTKDVETGDAEVLALAGVNLPDEPELKGPLKPVAETTPKERVAGVVAAGAVATSLVAIIIEQSALVVVAGVLSMLLGPYAYYQQTRLTDIATLQETTAVVQQEVDRLREENERLGSNVDELTTTVDKLTDIEQALEVISQTQGKSVDALEKQVEENRQILAQMKKSTKGRVIQNLISIIYRGDINQDDIISSDEVDEVIKGLQKIGGVTVHETLLRQAITDKSIEAVIDVVKNLLSDDIPQAQRIFEIEEQPDP